MTWRLRVFEAILAIVLLTGGIIHLVPAVELLRGQHAVAMLKQGVLPTREGFERLVESRAAALSWRELAEARIDRGTAFLALGLQGDRPDLLGAAIQDLEAGLARRPVQPHAWFRQAFALKTVGSLERAARAADLSMVTGPSIPELIHPRASLGLDLWPQLDPSARNRFAHEFARAAERDLDVFAGDVRSSGHAEEVFKALAPFPRVQAALERQLGAKAGREM